MAATTIRSKLRAVRRMMPLILAFACAHASAGHRAGVVAEVESEMRTAGQTEYRFGGEEGEGLDCSGYANRVLARAAPRSFASLRELRRRPRVREYVERLERGGDGWERVARVADLQPGDVIAWTHRPGERRADPRATGHVAFVVGWPEREGAGLFRVRVSDAARSGHSDDTRGGRSSGVGAGTILVAAGPRGEPVAVAWSLRGRFEQPEAIALGRPGS